MPQAAWQAGYFAIRRPQIWLKYTLSWTFFPSPFQIGRAYGIVSFGGMAEWSIATVLKTVG